MSGRADTAAFLRLPWRLYREQPAWVPPLVSDQQRLLDPRRHDYFRESEAGFFLARRAGLPVGRIAAFRNSRHLDAHRDGVGFFGFFETIDDPEVAAALLATAEGWLRERRLTVARGPANFTIYDEAGVLIDGFGHRPMAGMAYTPSYYAGLLERAGYRKAKDLFVHRVKWSELDVARLERLSALALRRANVRIRPLDTGRLESEAQFMAAVFAEAWRTHWGWMPIRESDFISYFQLYRPVIDPALIQLATVDGEPAAFAVVMPDANLALARANGRLWPLGWWHLLRLRRTARRHRAFMIGVRPKFRGAGLPLVFAQRYYGIARARRFEEMEFSWLAEDNVDVIAFVAGIGAKRVQTLRVYDKTLD